VINHVTTILETLLSNAVAVLRTVSKQTIAYVVNATALLSDILTKIGHVTIWPEDVFSIFSITKSVGQVLPF